MRGEVKRGVKSKGGSGMRKILFRGKRIDNGEWEYGGCVFTENKVCLIYNQTHSIDLQGCTVEENSVGQYTGLNDKNGTRAPPSCTLPMTSYSAVTLSTTHKKGLFP